MYEKNNQKGGASDVNDCAIRHTGPGTRHGNFPSLEGRQIATVASENQEGCCSMLHLTGTCVCGPRSQRAYTLVRNVQAQSNGFRDPRANLQ